MAHSEKNPLMNNLLGISGHWTTYLLNKWGDDDSGPNGFISIILQTLAVYMILFFASLPYGTTFLTSSLIWESNANSMHRMQTTIFA